MTSLGCCKIHRKLCVRLTYRELNGDGGADGLDAHFPAEQPGLEQIVTQLQCVLVPPHHPLCFLLPPCILCSPLPPLLLSKTGL